jgi:hypothetical protein
MSVMKFSVSRSVRGLWAAALIAVVSVGLKAHLAPHDPPQDQELRMAAAATARLGDFLAAHVQGPTTGQGQLSSPPYWAGFRFTAGGCERIAVPSPRNGELDARAGLLASPGDKISYVYGGSIRATPPADLVPPDYLLYRLLKPLGRADDRWSFYVTLIEPSACAGAASLPWRAL